MSEKDIMCHLVVILRHATEAVSMVQNDGANAPEFIEEMEGMNESLGELNNAFGLID